jgi:hypothetical protein
MNEDIEIEEFLKSRLEGDVAADPPRFGEIMRAASEASFAVAARRSHQWRLGLSLAAACVAVAFSFAVLRSQSPDPTPEATVANVIDLLRAADGAEVSSDAATVEEKLLAWQDAPYESAVFDLLASSIY